MSAKHTPGPWHVVPADTGWSGPGTIQAANGVFIAKPLTVNAEANARLIAAAPEMLAALRKARAHLYVSAPVGTHRAALIALIDSTIAKAEGRS